MSSRNTQFARIASAVGIAGFLAWMALSGEPEESAAGDAAPSPGVAPGSAPSPADEDGAVACGAPLGWRLADVDPRFGLERDEVAQAVASAASLWEQEGGRPLFAADSLRGMPVRLVYDHRQARTEARMRAEAELRRLDDALDATGDSLTAEAAALEADRETLARLRDGLTTDLASHNERVRRWNASGGFPADSILDGLEADEDSLRLRRQEVESRNGALEERAAILQDRTAELARRWERRDRRVEELEGAFPPVPVESGAYLHAVHATPEGRVVRGPEIRVFRFDDAEELVRVLAHELGHALGLGHVDDPEAIMSAERHRSEGPERPLTLHAADRRELRAVCGWPPR